MFTQFAFLFKDGPLIPLAAHQNGDYKYEVSITTGGWKNCGTTANISMILHGNENTSDVIKLTCDIHVKENCLLKATLIIFLFDKKCRWAR